MRYQIRCKTCSHTFWIRGHEEFDTNALVLDEDDPDWFDACEHVAGGGDYDVIDGEYPDDSE